jgi:hypothetical protein
MLYLCLFILGCSAVVVLIGAYLISGDKHTIKKERLSLYKIPSAFWDEYNSITLDIYYMSIANCETIRYKIEDFEYKYSQIIDHQIYHDRIGEILRNYKAKYELITNKNK